MTLSKKDFIFVASKMALHNSTRKMAYMALVEGKSFSETARVFNVTRQAVYKAARKIRIKHLELTGLPETWKQITLSCSPALAKKIKKLQENEVAELLEETEDS